MFVKNVKGYKTGPITSTPNPYFFPSQGISSSLSLSLPLQISQLQNLIHNVVELFSKGKKRILTFFLFLVRVFVVINWHNSLFDALW